MARFEPRGVQFGRPANPGGGNDPDEDLEGLPTPARIRTAARRQACLAKAAQIVQHLPGPGESLHALTTSRMDLTDVATAILDSHGGAHNIRVATLGYNARNLHTILAWLDAGKVGTLTLLASNFFRSHNGDLWGETLHELKARGCRAACANSHAKVLTLETRCGHFLTFEGSANLCGNGSGREQFALINDRDLHDWHATWIAECVERNHGKT